MAFPTIAFLFLTGDQYFCAAMAERYPARERYINVPLTAFPDRDLPLILYATGASIHLSHALVLGRNQAAMISPYS